ncbi:hypothetical protein [Gemmatimonas sp.]|uniref:hypothetical protein n=1 Tax=Gemmatimonas sp. TaxID=1962908 RepID=UPI00286DA63C|nr:hypothetical protein [Gemmatimonas sp.]
MDTYAALKRHVVLSHEEAVAVALFAAFTFADDAFQISPILAVLSPEKRCGKTTLLSLLSKLCKDTLAVSN